MNNIMKRYTSRICFKTNRKSNVLLLIHGAEY